MDSISIIKKISEKSSVKKDSKLKDSQNLQFALIRVFLNPTGKSLPETTIYVGCRRIIGEYEVIKRFQSAEEAKKHSIQKKVEIMFD